MLARAETGVVSLGFVHVVEVLQLTHEPWIEFGRAHNGALSSQFVTWTNRSVRLPLVEPGYQLMCVVSLVDCKAPRSYVPSYLYAPKTCRYTHIADVKCTSYYNEGSQLEPVFVPL